MIGGLLLALASAAMINIGFLLQHRGLRRSPAGGLAARLRAVIRDRSWIGGQALGWAGFITQIVAVAIAPLALVQAFAAGGLALSVPLAALIFGHRIGRRQVVAVTAIAAGLAVLPIGFSTAQDQLAGPTLVAVMAGGAIAGLALCAVPATWGRAVAAGVFYGLADAAIKAASLGWHAHGSAGLLSGWTALAAVGTFAGFLAFQSALEHDGAVSAISLMNALAALVALGCGLLALGEGLGRGPETVLAHLGAIAVVLGCVPVLAATQNAIVESTEDRGDRTAATAAVAGAASASR
ncbi:MAG: hypothetical protein WBQ18_11205 [Solirubrobacteraceae bacterium]